MTSTRSNLSALYFDLKHCVSKKKNNDKAKQAGPAVVAINPKNLFIYRIETGGSSDGLPIEGVDVSGRNEISVVVVRRVCLEVATGVAWRGVAWRPWKTNRRTGTLLEIMCYFDI